MTGNGSRHFFRFPRSRRLLRPEQFVRVYESGRSSRTGPLVVHALPNDLDFSRMGLSISRRVGNAVLRNRIKRRLREAFRHMQGDLPGSYDLVITVQKHEPLPLSGYQKALSKAAGSLHDAWNKRKQDDDAAPLDP